MKQHSRVHVYGWITDLTDKLMNFETLTWRPGPYSHTASSHIPL